MKKVLIIAGPSAVGKTTLAHSLLERDTRFEFVRSVTSRAPRGDAFDNEYIYVSEDEFRILITSGGVLEHTEYAGNLYGTPRSEIERILGEGRVPFLILDLAGVSSVVKNGDLDACAVYLYAPLSVLDHRLAARYGNDSSRLYNRMEQNRSDYATRDFWIDDFYATIENSGNVEKSTEEILEVFSAFEAGEPAKKRHLFAF